MRGTKSFVGKEATRSFGDDRVFALHNRIVNIHPVPESEGLPAEYVKAMLELDAALADHHEILNAEFVVMSERITSITENNCVDANPADAAFSAAVDTLFLEFMGRYMDMRTLFTMIEHYRSSVAPQPGFWGNYVNVEVSSYGLATSMVYPIHLLPAECGYDEHQRVSQEKVFLSLLEIIEVAHYMSHLPLAGSTGFWLSFAEPIADFLDSIRSLPSA